MYKSKVRFSYLISHFMHFLETIGLGSRTSRKYTRKVHTTAPAHKSCSLPTNYAISFSLWHFHWLVVVSRSRLHRSAFYLKYRYFQSLPVTWRQPWKLGKGDMPLRENLYFPYGEYKIKGKPKKERAYPKYGIRQARLDLMQKWTKLCSRHYKETLPHKKKRIRLVITWRPRKLGEGRIHHGESIHFP